MATTGCSRGELEHGAAVPAGTLDELHDELALADILALRVDVGYGVAGVGWWVVLSGVFGLLSLLGR